MSEKEPFAHSRRTFHRFVVGELRVAMASPSAQPARAGEIEPHPQACQEALERLLRGNERFLSGKLVRPHISQQWRERLDASEVVPSVGGLTKHVLFLREASRQYSQEVEDVKNSPLPTLFSESFERIEYSLEHLDSRIKCLRRERPAAASVPRLAASVSSLNFPLSEEEFSVL